MQEKSGKFRRTMLIIAAYHAAATAVAVLALFFMTSGGGESHADSPAIDMIAGILQGLAIPMAWLVEHSLHLKQIEPPFIILIALRLTNSLIAGALAAWVWLFIQQRRAATH